MERRFCAPLFAALFAIVYFATPALGREPAGDATAPGAPRGSQELRIAQSAPSPQNSRIAQATPNSRSARESADDHAEDPRHAGHRHDPVLDEIVVSAPLPGQRRFDLVRGSTVLDEAELQRELRTTLGDTLEKQPGIASSGFVPGAGRPVIRGLDGPRVSVLQNGVGVWDESESSTDHHAVAANPALARRVEVLRGAGTLRFSNSAVGGVVNVLDGRVPDMRPPDAEGALRLNYGSNADLRGGASRLLFGAGNFAFHAAGGLQRSHDLEVRGAPLSLSAQAEAEADDPLLAARDVVPNSAMRSGEGGFGISRIFESGHVGLSWRRMESRFGVPLPHGHEEDDHGMGNMQMGAMHMDDDDDDDHEEEDAQVELDTEQDRFDLAGAWRGVPGPFDSVDFHGVYGDFTQDELEDGQVGTRFTRRGTELRVELQQRRAETAAGALDGVLGLHARSERRGTQGEEAFTPSHDSQYWAFFAAEEFSLGRVNLEGGLRFERSSLRPAQGAQFARRNFSTWSASLGASWTPQPDLLLGLSLSRGARPPSAAELYAEGEHIAAASYEIGDADLEEEEVWNAELTARRRQGRITGSLNLFVTRFDSFIFLSDSNCPMPMQQQVDLPVRCFQQSDADFQGGELELALTLPLPEGALRFELGADYVRGEQQGGAALPRIPPLRLRLGVGLQTQRFDWHLDWLRVASQNRAAAGELPTGDYHVLGGEIAFRPIASNPGLSFFLQARNLTNRAGRSHVSLHKERVPIAGRDIRAGLRLQF